MQIKTQRQMPTEQSQTKNKRFMNAFLKAKNENIKKTWNLTHKKYCFKPNFYWFLLYFNTFTDGLVHNLPVHEFSVLFYSKSKSSPESRHFTQQNTDNDVIILLRLHASFPNNIML